MNPITNKEQQVTYLKERLEIFLEVLDAIDPETTELEDIDRLIQMMDDLEQKMDQFQTREEIPAEPFDRKMDEVWTEEGCLTGK